MIRRIIGFRWTEYYLQMTDSTTHGAWRKMKMARQDQRAVHVDDPVGFV